MNNMTQDFLNASAWSGQLYSGEWAAAGAGTEDIYSPGDNSFIEKIGAASMDDLSRAAEAAKAAQPAWEAQPASKRAEILNKAADVLLANADELIPWIIRETGSVMPKAAMEVEIGASFLRSAAEAALISTTQSLKSTDGRKEELYRVAHGVVGVISPFNLPLVLSVRAVAAALATGNAVILKPDQRTPITGGVMVMRIFEEAGLPANVLHFIPGGAEIGAAICEDPNVAMVSFTGSPLAGSKVGEVCGRNFKKVQLELGGKNALIVMDDADLEVAASNCAWGAWLHQGQVCMATGLILAPTVHADKLANMLAEKASHLPSGDPTNSECALGPLIHQDAANRIEQVVQDAISKGASLLAGGKSDGSYFPATVLSGVKPGMRAFEEEIFGPVAVIVSYENEDHAVELANSTEFGLAGAVIGKDIVRARALGDRLKVGHLHINDQTTVASPLAPFGGRGKSGNGSRISGPAIWEEFSQWVWVTTKTEATSYPF